MRNREEELLRKIGGTYLGERLEALREIYRELDERQEVFRQHFRLRCREDCCSCCTHFMPELTETESLYLALGTVAGGREQETEELLARCDTEKRLCPLCDAGAPVYHCRVYDYRPLVCRLFGFAAVKDKNGLLNYGKCRWNTEGREVSQEELEAGKDLVVNMGDYGIRIAELDPENPSSGLLYQSYPASLQKIQLLLDYADSNDREPSR